MIGEETDMTEYDNMEDETKEFDQFDETELQDKVVDLQEDESPDACEIDDINHDDVPDYDEAIDQIDESENFLLEEVYHDDFDNFQQPLDVAIEVDEDMDTTSFLDLDEHVDSLVMDMNDIFYSDDE